MTEEDAPRPRHQWKRIETISPLFSGWDGERQVGRLLGPANRPELWKWNLVCVDGVKNVGKLGTSSYGTDDTARFAAKACEDAYDDAMAGRLFGMTQQDVADILAHEEFMPKRRAGLI